MNVLKAKTDNGYQKWQEKENPMKTLKKSFTDIIRIKDKAGNRPDLKFNPCQLHIIRKKKKITCLVCP